MLRLRCSPGMMIWKESFWHSSAHILAQSILDFYPNAKLTIGPAIEKRILL